MFNREIVVTTILVSLCCAALGMLVWLKLMSLLEVAIIIVMGVLLAAGTLFLYSKIWEEEE